MARFKDCAEIKDHSLIVLRDDGSKNDCHFVINNTSRQSITIVHIDGCVIKQGIRCDYLVLPETVVPTEEIYIELKGSDVKHAIDQLENTILKISSNVKDTNKQCFIIVRSHCPMHNGQIQKNQIFFKKKYKSTLKVCKYKYIFTI
jgi:hypothetical protein